MMQLLVVALGCCVLVWGGMLLQREFDFRARRRHHLARLVIERRTAVRCANCDLDRKWVLYDAQPCPGPGAAADGLHAWRDASDR